MAIDGQTLPLILEQDLLKAKLVEILKHANSAIFGRMTPIQKAQIAVLAKTDLQKHTLAIGDGYNDDHMLSNSDIGIKIKSQDINMPDI